MLVPTSQFFLPLRFCDCDGSVFLSLSPSLSLYFSLALSYYLLLFMISPSNATPRSWFMRANVYDVQKFNRTRFAMFSPFRSTNWRVWGGFCEGFFFLYACRAYRSKRNGASNKQWRLTSPINLHPWCLRPLQTVTERTLPMGISQRERKRRKSYRNTRTRTSVQKKGLGCGEGGTIYLWLFGEQ